jgi:uncharacterized membrane protein
MNKREAGILLIGLGIGLILGIKLGPDFSLLVLPNLLIVVGIILLFPRREAQKSN